MVNIMAINNELSRCLGCIKKPCMINCPLNNDIPEIIKLLKDNKNEEAYQLLSNTTCLGSICGRVCPHMCMLNCTKGKIDNSINIGSIEMYLSDMFLDKDYDKKDSIDKKVAIIGGGPTGLTCAYFLAREGIDVTIFEKHEKLGGLLEYGIPEYRLDRNILKRNINKILKLGINVELNRNIDSLEELNEYDAIYIGIGANKSRMLNIKGEDKDNVLGGNELLEYGNYPDFKDKIVNIIGGGNVAIDVARTIKRMNAKEVNIIYRRSEKEMPALSSEVEEAKLEGINIIYKTNIVEVLDKKIELIKTDLIDKGEGRLSPINIEGSNYKIKNDYVIKALGSLPLDIVKNYNLELDNGFIKVNNYHTSKEGVFAGGEITNTGGTISSAARDGREAAKEIINYLKEG